MPHADPADPGAAEPQPDYIDHDSLIAELNTLLEAERAGAQVAAGLVAEAGRAELQALARVIQRDEVRWCRMLLAAIRTLQGAPSPAVGGFYQQAVAIPEVEARFAFVNRGQGWVVRKLKSLIPRVQSEDLQADLLKMLAAHDYNITLAGETLAGLTAQDARTA